MTKIGKEFDLEDTIDENNELKQHLQKEVR